MHGEIPYDLSDPTKAIMTYARKLTLTPSEMGESDLDALRHAALSEEQVLDVVFISCLFNFMTRLADGLGVAVEPAKERGVNAWLDDRPGAEWEWLRHNPAERRDVPS